MHNHVPEPVEGRSPGTGMADGCELIPGLWEQVLSEVS